MSDYLYYWRPSTPRGGFLNHIASDQLERVHKGDRLWVVTVDDKKLILFGKMTVFAVVSQREAERRLKTEDIWDATFHAIAKKGNAEPMENIELGKRALQLRFQSTTGRDRWQGFRVPTYKLCGS